MNKEMQKLLKAINDKKNEVKSLVNDGKLDKAKAAKEELKELQEKFDLLFDLDEEEHEEIEDKVAMGTAKTIGAKADKKNLVKAFVNIVKCGFLKREPDERMLYILELIIDGSEVGLPLGFYTSQWLSNFMLQPLDHFIKEQLKAVHYIRYMDDMVVFGKNKKELHRMQQEIERFLREKFNLQMKGNWQVFRFDYTEKKTGKRKGRPLDFMGFQFYHDKTILRESIMLSCTRKVNRVAKKEKITWYDATAILSYMGYLSNTDTYDMYLQRVKPYVNVKKLKKIVSKHSKRKEREKHERMERSVRNGGRTAGGVRHNSVTDNGISETQYQESNERGCRRKENHRMAARGA